ncbi:MAG: methyltransferase domain-containing protein [Gammaproteobacteria bacterium]|nr:methyltransferase domain-containing protein [Gammaproteobacteria bacterium]
MNRDELIETWLREEQQPFTGWDFSHLDGRLIGGREHWSYLDRAAELMRRSSSVVDMDTGSGEELLNLQQHWPSRVVATEDYPPNFELATERLSALGVQIVKAAVSDTDPMPFADGEFDLVLNRHAAFNHREVARILSGGGTFLTQQVHGMWAWDLKAAFDVAPQFPDATPEKYVPRLEASGLAIRTVEEWEGRLVFTDVRAIVYYLKAIPWEVPGFSVKTHLGYLLALQERLEAGGELGFHAAKYLIEARKP